MLPFIAAGVVTLAVAGYTAYKKYDTTKTPVPPVPIGRFAIWGQPNSGKTTFISRLLGKTVYAGQKEATLHRTVHKNVTVSIGKRDYRINEITDLPGTDDRLGDWQKLVQSHEHVFYLLNLSRTDAPYLAKVRRDIGATAEALRASSKTAKQLHIIASHVDLSAWKDVDVAQVCNILQSDGEFRKLYESIDGVAGYVYATNLMDEVNFKRLIESIVSDVRGHA